MSDGRSIRLPSAKFAQVREPGRNGPAVTRSPRVGRGGSNPPPCTKCQRARIGIAACLRNRCLRVRISPLAPDFLIRRDYCGLGGEYTPNSGEVANGKPIHTQMPSNRALLRKAATAAPGTALVRYSGNSRTAGHGLCSCERLMLAHIATVQKPLSCRMRSET